MTIRKVCLAVIPALVLVIMRVLLYFAGSASVTLPLSPLWIRCIVDLVLIAALLPVYLIWRKRAERRGPSRGSRGSTSR